ARQGATEAHRAGAGGRRGAFVRVLSRPDPGLSRRALTAGRRLRIDAGGVVVRLARYGCRRQFSVGTWSLDEPPRRRAGVLAPADHADAVHPYVTDTGRQLVRIVEGSVVGDGGGVEQHDVGFEALAQ